MIAFDTDVLVQVLLGKSSFAERAREISVDQQSVPIVVIEEIFRGRLNSIRKAESGKGRIAVRRAYELFERSFRDPRQVRTLAYTTEADARFDEWRRARLRLSTHDLRIAAICVAHSAVLVSSNRRDFERVPGLSVTFWQ